MRKELGHGTHLRLVVKVDRSAHWTSPGQTRMGLEALGMMVEGVSGKHRLEVGGGGCSCWHGGWGGEVRRHSRWRSVALGAEKQEDTDRTGAELQEGW